MNDLITQMNVLTGKGTEMLFLGLLVFMRVGAALSLLPAFGEQSVPQRVRLILALAFTAIVAPAVQDMPHAVAQTIWPLIVETIIGLMLGMGLRVFIFVLQTAGAMAAQASTLSQMFGDAGPEPQPAISNLLIMAGLAIAVAAGLHVRVCQLFILSYQIVPMGLLPNSADAAQWGVGQIGHAFTLAFMLAAPFSIAALLYNIALGVINKAMPALMVSFIGAPALTLGSMVMMVLTAPLALSLWLQAMQSFLATPFPAMP